jgi:hypothetical protein
MYYTTFYQLSDVLLALLVVDAFVLLELTISKLRKNRRKKYEYRHHTKLVSK